MFLPSLCEHTPVACEHCGRDLTPLDWDSPGFWYHRDGLLLCSANPSVRS